ncbi:MAG: hypothetical protein J0M34_03765 [Alphaproteobacteria bacterium]|nr:hypothetical protein [Alphaproteobacteria bacterium]
MRFILPLLLIASSAVAQTADPAANFPKEAITNVQQPGAPKVPDSPPAPASPAQPAAPDAWPANTVPVFLISCTQGNTQLIAPCRCVITNLMQSMTHREFLEISAKNAIEKDIRYTSARQQCAMKSQAQKQK